MILPQHSSPSSTTMEYFVEQRSPHLTIHFSPSPAAAEEEATTSSMQTTSTQPINILQPNPHARILHFNTAPSQLLETRPLMCMLEASEEEEEDKPRIVLPTKALSSANNTKNDLRLYRERILNEAMRRRLLEDKREESINESDKENNADANRSRSRKRLNSEMCTDCYETFEGTSTNNFSNNYMPFSELDDGIASADDESDMDDCAQVPDVSASTLSNFWGDTDDDALIPMPTTFHSIGDIIGYAKVVRAQRNEALGKLNSVIGQFSDALAVYSTSTMRMQEAVNKS